MASEDRITEKVYCYDHPSAYRQDNSAMWAALMSKNESPLEAAALLNGGMGNQWNNPFIYLVWMMMANRMGGFGWNEGFGNPNTAQNIEIQSQLDSLRSQMQDNQNTNAIMDAIKGVGGDLNQLATQLNCDFNTLNASICDVRMGISKLSGEIGFSAEKVINAVTLGNCNIVQQLKDCCCATQKAILEQGYQNQLAIERQTNQLQTGMDFINRSIERGFAASDYATQKQTCEIIQAGNANTQRIVDLLNNHWKDEQANQIQDLKFQLSQERQNNLILNRLNNLGGCGGNGCGCGCGQ